MVLDFQKLNNIIIICPFNTKEQILMYLNQENNLKNIKVLSDIELDVEVNLKFNQNTITYLYLNHSIKPEIANIYLKNMRYINEFNKKQNYKFTFLYNLKKELIDNRLLIKRPIINNYQKVIVYGFNVIDNNLEKNIQKLKLPYEIIKENSHNCINCIYEFDDIEEEVLFVYNQICELLTNGVDINKIKIANINDDYLNYFDKYQSMFNVPIQKIKTEKLINYPISKEFINLLLETNSYEETIKKMMDKKQNFDVINQFIQICNEFILYEPCQIIDLIIYKLKNTQNTINELNNCVEFINFYNNIYDKDYHIFVVGFNQNILPKNYKDEDYFSNSEKKLLGLETSFQLNKNEKNKLQIELNKPYQKYISYKLKTAFMKFYPSPIIEELKLDVIKYNKDHLISFSKSVDKIKLAKELDGLYKKNEDESLNVLHSNYQIDYKQFNNQYQSINKNKLQKYMIDNNINLSYSALNCFYECQFKYYLNYILKLKKQENTQATDIGNLFHYVLSKQDEENFNFDKEYDNYIKEYINNEEKYYVLKLKKLLKDIIEINKENLQYTKFTNFLYEKEVKINFNQSINIYFKGFIDKIMYYVENDTAYVSIIDYKTGNTDIKLDKIQYGLSLQLPVYLYLIKHSDLFKNIIVVGFYLQKLLHEPKKSNLDEKELLKNDLKLNGYSIDNIDLLSKFDSSLENSKFISSLKLKKDNSFYATSRVLSAERMDKINDVVEEKIKEAIEKIANADFSINPKMYHNKNQSCEFCDFYDCCFKTNKDLIYLVSKDGDEDGSNEMD